ncbi:MAG: hypothetical protein H7A39_01430 [Chlamydiales bacterium]|nr:hypothetical protein [Chlamydiales bacterium]
MPITNINSFPVEILYKIFNEYDVDLRKIELVCTCWQRVVELSYKNIYNQMIGSSHDEYQASMKNAIKERYFTLSEVYHKLRSANEFPDLKESTFCALDLLKNKNRVVNASNRDLITNQFNPLCACYSIRDFLLTGYGAESEPENGGRLSIIEHLGTTTEQQLSLFLQWRKDAPPNGANRMICIGGDLNQCMLFDNKDGIGSSNQDPESRFILLAGSKKFSSITRMLSEEMFSLLEKYLPQEFRLR